MSLRQFIACNASFSSACYNTAKQRVCWPSNETQLTGCRVSMSTTTSIELTSAYDLYKRRPWKTHNTCLCWQYNTIFVYWGLTERKLNNRGYSLSLKLILYTYIFIQHALGWSTFFNFLFCHGARLQIVLPYEEKM